MTGETPGAYICNRPLTEAARLLAEREDRILDIALEYQYQSQAALTGRLNGLPVSRRDSTGAGFLTDLVAVRADLGQLGLEAGHRSLETLLAVPTALEGGPGCLAGRLLAGSSAAGAVATSSRVAAAGPVRLTAARWLANSLPIPRRPSVRGLRASRRGTARSRRTSWVKGSIDGVPVSLLVECDGHTYHDRTPEQAARDRQRDRFLKLTDYEVVRFAASEITSDPEGCALEVFSQMVAVARRAGPRPQPVASGLSAKCGLKASRMAPRPFDPA